MLKSIIRSIISNLYLSSSVVAYWSELLLVFAPNEAIGKQETLYLFRLLVKRIAKRFERVEFFISQEHVHARHEYRRICGKWSILYPLKVLFAGGDFEMVFDDTEVGVDIIVEQHKRRFGFHAVVVVEDEEELLLIDSRRSQ